MSRFSSQTALDEYTLRVIRTIRREINEEGVQHSREFFRRQESIMIKRTQGRGRRINISGSSVKFVDVEKGKNSGAETKLNVRDEASGLATLRRLGRIYEASGVEAIASVFDQLRLFETNVEAIRAPKLYRQADDFLASDASNVSGFLAQLRQNKPEAIEAIERDMHSVMPWFKEFRFVPTGHSVDDFRLEIVERGISGSTPLTHASFGTVRSIALFAMLNDPNPPKLTCIEEIDHGLHPYALDVLVDRLREASNRTQIMLATHSPALVNRLDPTELIIVERHPDSGGTIVMKPNPKDVARLSQETEYKLGELWFSGILSEFAQ